MIKRMIDIIVSSIFIIVFSPVLVVLTILIKLESRGPVIFKQQRVGLNGDTFFIYKFRSMVVGADSKGPYYTQKNDSRITRVGRFVRKTSLDELPQLLNVFKGDMSLVGPRPDLPVQEQGYTKEEWDKRNTVLPGITGLAQALMRSAATAEQRKQLDLEYVDKTSVLFDLWILMMTIKQVLFRGGN